MREDGVGRGPHRQALVRETSPRRRCRRGPCRAAAARGSAPASWRSRSSPSSSSTRSRSGRWPSDTRHFTPLASMMTRGIRSRYLRVDALAQRSAGSLTCASAETMKYLFGIAGARGARPAGVPGRLRAPEVGLVDDELGRAHARLPPVHQRERRRRVVVRLEHGLHRRADRHRLRQDRREGCRSCGRCPPAAARPAPRCRAGAPERGMHGMPRALPANRSAPRALDAPPSPGRSDRQRWQIHSGPHCQALAAAAALHAQLVLRACPPSTARRGRRARRPGAGRPAGR